MFERTVQFFLVLVCFLTNDFLVSGKRTAGDEIPVSMNKVWPASNPMETYGFYDALPVCQPEAIEEKSMSLGQILRGDRISNSLYKINFEEDKQNQAICSKTLDFHDIQTLQNAIAERYLFEIYVADLPIIQPVGYHKNDNAENERFLLSTSFDFTLGSDDKEVVSANLTTTNRLIDITNLSEGTTIEFTYSVQWVKIYSISSAERIENQLSSFIIPQSRGLDIRWISILNSFVLSFFIFSLLFIIILRVVRTDLAPFLRISDEELASVEDDAGWKLLHADVFRSPPHRMWLCACVGSGAHLTLVSFIVLAIACAYPFFQRGALFSTALIGYLLTSFISGFISARLYKKMGGVKWAWALLLVSIMFPAPVFCVWSILNLVAIFYGSTIALPFSTATAVFLLFVFVTFPLTLIGGIIGKQSAAKQIDNGPVFPCQPNKIPRQIPRASGVKNPWLQLLTAAFLPFTAIYIELHYIFSSLWGNRIYHLYGVLLCAFFVLLLVCGTLAVLLTYFHLNSENHQWWWRSFAMGAATALYFFAHSVYYFFSSSRMHGFLQIMFFFGYSLLAAWAFALVLGFISFSSSYLFVDYIYSQSKAE